MNSAYATVDHVFTVPLDHAAPHGPTIQIFAREVTEVGKVGDQLPWLLYLQGGPGGKSPRPSAGSPGWLPQALKTHRVLLLDQRGTGRSTPVTARAASRFASPARLAEHLGHFRADSIVADAELIRRQLCGDEPWETLGQSYGGFITLTYLSQAPEGLRACYVTGGLPGLSATADDVYARTYPRVRDRVRDFYTRYPHDAARLRRIAHLLATTDVRLPDGDRLTSHRLRTLGLVLGMGDGFERIHWLLDEALDEHGKPTDTFLHQVMTLTGFIDNPLFAVMQETLYGQGAGPTNWAASRAMAAFPEFAEGADPLLLTGEMIYPWMFREISGLRPFADAADLLAERSDWPPLYDRRRLAANRVPLAALVYHDDMYVDAGLSLCTAREVGATRVWVTNEWEHDGVTAAGDRVLSRLMDLAAGRA
ncbi:MULTISPECIES: alpha/beta fold hydrolase [Streptomyces]|uniref:Alpha/beta fold hydrolase n=2 Tax=Streptomyces TaxID=1883 RepID=A0A420UWT0_9ACTN|nr:MULTISPECIES: alpha/beta fold hydrolase [Streptomyces]KNE83879.1 proline iminopeptidase [Streptomyces fradiae]OFA55757.1 proline iminopeptidase [Streptomyces fradiae]PQM23888.1 proline iminopeptidase [Streptomyces xinghaiensis]RKM92002.1 alpha/beta fold hydrolase [Streptomyces xinghaiensis]RNC73580.1 alpha/beta fold hydrolase [Streptomyces xinghaiensis]